MCSAPVLEEVDDLDQLVLGVIDPGHILERDPLMLAGRHPPRGRAPEAAEHAARSATHLAAVQPDEETDQQDRRKDQGVHSRDCDHAGGEAAIVIIKIRPQSVAKSQGYKKRLADIMSVVPCNPGGQDRMIRSK